MSDVARIDRRAFLAALAAGLAGAEARSRRAPHAAEPGFLHPDEEDALIGRWSREHAAFVEVRSVRQFCGRRAYLVAVGARRGREGRPAGLFAAPHAHEPAGSAAMLDVIEALLAGKGLDGRPLPLDRDEILHRLTLCFIPDANPEGRARAPVRFWDGSFGDDRAFLDIAFGVDAETGGRAPREASWRPSERRRARIGIVYERIAEDLYVEPNRDHRSSYFRLAGMARSSYRVRRWLDLHQTEFERSGASAQVLLPIIQAELPAAIRDENAAWASRITGVWTRARLGKILEPAALGYRGKQRELLVESMGAIQRAMPQISTEVRNNDPGTPPAAQRRLQEIAIVETVRRMLERAERR